MNKPRFHLPTRLLALLLSIVMIAGMLPKFTLPVTAVGTDQAIDATKVADPSTMNDWENFFGPSKLSTEFAGGVWTDKSVFTDVASYKAAVGSTNVTMDSEDNFLVALSAIAANKEVIGLSSTPTDTMLVLDLSNSMDTIGAVPSMVQATNSAISTLLTQNSYNRVGVVLYSGNTSTRYNATTSTATVILPLDRYTTSTEGVYLTVTGESDTTVSVASGVLNGKKDPVSDFKNTNGSTYIQNGLYQAWEQFDSKNDPVINEPGSLLHGVRRTPVVVLMTDGAPTIATETYYNVGTSNVGDGSDTTDRITFLTQLTAACVKGKLKAEYGTDAKFYTLGLGTGNSENATSVLYPTGTNDTVSGWWNNFLAGTPGEDVEIIPDTSFFGDNSWDLYRDDAVTEKNYVDRYWYAADTSAMIEAFKGIVNEIKLQSAYSATLVQSGDRDLDGYISFEDEIGELMEVKDIKGIRLGSTLFTGSELAKSLNTGAMGSVTAPSDYGNEFVETVKERIGIETSTAQALIGYAYNAGQLNYVSDTNYSNYIGWYADADGEYAGFWQESYGMENAPADAKYINKSYGYLGESGSSDMMHVVVMLRTEIATSHQDVVFEIPASLIPMVTYKVTTNGSSLESATKLERIGADPIRLVYEVGLRSDINSINIDQKVAEYLETYPDGHIHNHDGEYIFYTNSWGTGDGNQDPTFSQDLIPYIAESHFHPSFENERYYYTEDTPIYVKNGNSYALYSGSTAPAGEGYYHRRTVVTAATNGGAASVDYIYAPIAPATLSDADHIGWDTDHWEVLKGVAYTETARFDRYKGNNTDANGAVGNNTETLEYSNYPLVVHDDAGFNIYAILGNNGKLTVSPVQGIRLSKAVSQASTQANAPDEFEFVVTLKPAVAESAIDFVDANGNTWTGTPDVDVNNNETVITLTLKDGEEVLITGIPTNTEYTVKETQTIYYNSDKANDTVTGTVIDNKLDAIAFTNSPRKASELTITKTVVHPFVEEPTALKNINFTVLVDLGIHASNMVFHLADGRDVTANQAGILELTLKDEDSVTITGLLEDTPYTVTEIAIPDGFEFDANASTNVGTKTYLTAGHNAAHVVNNYKVDGPITPSITVTGTKTVSGNYTGDETFTFVVERYMGVSQQYPTGYKTVGTSNAKAGGTYTITMNESYDAVGTYNYRITETSGTTTGMSYDASQGLFSVIVTDDNLDGALEYTVSNYANTTVSADYTTVTKDYTNTYSTTSTHVDIDVEKILHNDTGVEIPLDVFHFGLYEAGKTEPTYQATTNATGKATIRIPLDTAGTFTYTLKEIPGTTAGMSYDKTEYTVTINVEDVNSQLVATVVTDKDTTNADNTITAAFVNTYDLTDTKAVLTGDKDLIRGYDNSQVALTGGEFTFQLWTANDDFTANTLLDEVTNGKDGAFTFANLPALSYSKVGGYRYIIREVPGNDSTVTYDSRDYYVLVNVVADGAALKANVYYRAEGASQGSALAQFTNIYNVTGTASTKISGTKTLKQLQGSWSPVGGEFTFQLKDASGTVIDTAVNAPNGTFSFDTITYTVADIGKTFTYTVTEEAGNENYIGYSQASYTVTVEVKDKGDGTIEAVQTISGSGNTIAFENTYTAKSTSTSFSGTKNLTGRTLKDGDFTFELYASDKDFSKRGTLVDSDTNTNGAFTVSTETYTATGTHYYILTEDIPENRQGVGYDANEYHITVQVIDRGIGQLELLETIYKPGTQTYGGPITFSNTYTAQPTEWTLSGTKKYDKVLFGNEFTFQLKLGSEVLQSKTNDAAGAFSFDAVALDKAQDYVFTVIEDATNPLPYVTYDETTYTITVPVKDDGKGALYVDEDNITIVSDKAGAQNEVIFNNSYKIVNGASVQIGGAKYYLGADLRNETFSFRLTGHGIDETVTATAANADSGSFVFNTINYTSDDLGKTFTYTVKEVIPAGAVEQDDGDWLLDGIFYDPAEYTVVVEITDDSMGNLVALKKVFAGTTETDQIVFTNSYNIVEGSEVTLTGVKELHGKDIASLTDEQKFRFALHESNEQFNVLGTRLQTVTHDENGTFTFDALEYDQADIGKHYYLVREIIPTEAEQQPDGSHLLDGMTYDITNYKITIDVQDDGNGGLKETVSIVGGGTPNTIVFNNYYNVADKDLVIDGTKTYPKGFATDTFTFGLFTEGHKIDEATNDTDGNFAFDPITYKQADIGKTFTYTVQEIAGAKDYIKYDKSEFTVTVKVEDNGDGTLKLTKTVTKENQNADLNFTNAYVNKGTGSVSLGGKKAYINSINGSQITVAPNLFTFQLKQGNTVLQTVRNLAGGAFVFDAIDYDADDIGETYTYTISEVKGNLPYVTYDENTVYTVTVKVEDDDQGGLKITKTIRDKSGQEVTDADIAFTNTYNIITGGSVVIDGTKTYVDGRTQEKLNIPANTFYFNITGDKNVNETVSAGTDGSFRFPAISYTAADIGNTYTYTVTEVDDGKGYITHDTNIFTVEVKVEDNGTGGLKITKTIADGSTSVDGISFTNTYVNSGTGAVPVTGLKKYTKTLTGNEFTFILSEITEGSTQETQLQTVKNGNGGVITFTDLTYDADDIGKTFTYTVREDIPTDAVKQANGTYVKDGITYDPAVYTILVSVADNGTGGLTITKKVNNVDTDNVSVVFDNAYNITGTGILELNGTKTLTGGKTLTDGEFSFGLYRNNTLVGQAVKNAGNSFTLTDTYDKDDISSTPIVYTVKEVIPTEATKNADGTYTYGNITYPGTVYTVEVTVSDNGKGGIDVNHTIVGATAIAFENVYTPDDIQINLNVQKVVESKTADTIAPEGFKFTLSGDGIQDVTKASDADGKAAFTLKFTKDHIGQTFNFQITEVDTKVTGVTYDKNVHKVSIAITQNTTGELVSTITLNDSQVAAVNVVFTNTYDKSATPETGDDFNVVLVCTLLAISGMAIVSLLVVGKKKRA